MPLLAAVPSSPSTAERPCPTLERMLRLGRVGPGQAVAAAGRAAAAVQIGLLRKGFDRVASACAGGCGGEPASCDALLLTGPCSEAEIAALADGAVRLLAPRGVLVAHELSPDGDVALTRVLAAHGFEVDWVVHDMAGPCLVAMGLHRVSARAELARAA